MVHKRELTEQEMEDILDQDIKMLDALHGKAHPLGEIKVRGSDLYQRAHAAEDESASGGETDAGGQ